MAGRRNIHGAGRTRRPLAFEKCEPRLALATTAGAIDAEGGLIDLDVVAGDSIFVTSSANLGATLSQFAFDREQLAQRAQQWLMNHDAVDGSWQFLSEGMTRRIELLDSVANSLGLSGAEEVTVTGALAGDSDVLRIDAPAARLDDAEGGAIQLTAVLEPNDWLPDESAAASTIADSPAVPVGAPLSGVGTDSPTSPIETLRARAVVFRVAQAEVAPASSEELLSSLAEARVTFAAATNARSDLHGEPADSEAVRAGLTSARRDVLVADPAWRTPAESDAVRGSRTTAPHRDETAAPSAPGAAIAADAALAAWDDELAAPSAESDAGLAFAAVRERSVVALALAAATGAVPLVRRFRRRGPALPALRMAPRNRPVA